MFKVRWCDAFCYSSDRCSNCPFALGLIFAFANGIAGASHAFIVGKLVESLNPFAD